MEPLGLVKVLRFRETGNSPSYYPSPLYRHGVAVRRHSVSDVLHAQRQRNSGDPPVLPDVQQSLLWRPSRAIFVLAGAKRFHVRDHQHADLHKASPKSFGKFEMFLIQLRGLCRRSNIVTNLNPVKLCDPLGDSNVWAALFPLVIGEENDTQPIRDSKYIVVAARLDTTSLFEETAGAESPITGAVALLAVAKLLKEMLPTTEVGGKQYKITFLVAAPPNFEVFSKNQRAVHIIQRRDLRLHRLSASSLRHGTWTISH